MPRIILSSLLLFSFVFAFPQNDQPGKNDKLTEVAKEIMTEAGLCALITYDSAGSVNVRTMQPFPPEENLIVWFGTTASSRKVQDIKNKPECVLYYASPDASGYVVLKGKAVLVNDDELKQKYWMDSWEDFYPDRSYYQLIRFSPNLMEILSTRHNITGDTISWKVPTIEFE